MKVGDLVRFSPAWLYEEGYCEKEYDRYTGVGIIFGEDEHVDKLIGEGEPVLRHGWHKAYLVKWSKGLYDTWERAHSLEVISENR